MEMATSLELQPITDGRERSVEKHLQTCQGLDGSPHPDIQSKPRQENLEVTEELAAGAPQVLDLLNYIEQVENRLHRCMDVVVAYDQMRACTGHAADNLAVLKHITPNLIRPDPVKRKGGIKARRLIAATSDLYRAQLAGLS